MGHILSEHVANRQPFWRSIAQDQTANTIVISAVALLPLLAMVGGGVDASRYYMAEARLQAACDAGALAARRAMADDAFESEHEQIGNDFFDQNYSDGLFGLENRERTYVGTAEGQVNGTATGVLPTSIMGAFGFEQFELSVNCTADINISNSDIMFVLDVTGSMNCAPDNPGGGNCGNTPDPGSKIEALQDAVMTFYDTVEASTSPNAQVRYGAVPYASNVNVGGELVAANPDWMAQNAIFQSRFARYELDSEWTQVATNVTSIELDDDEEYIGRTTNTQYVGSSSECDALEPDDFDDLVRTDLGTHQGVISQTVDGDTRTTSYRDDNETIWRGEGYTEYRSSDGRCRYGWNVYEDRGDVFFDIVEELTEEVVFDEWIYAEIDTANPPGGNPAGSPAGWEAVDLTTLYDDTRTVDLPIGNNGAMQAVGWDGCIEEADTVSDATFGTVPAGALDLNINLVPANDAERWRPILRNAVWERRNGDGFPGNTSTSTNRGNRTTGDVAETQRINGNGVIVGQSRPGYTCATPAFRLRDITRADMQTFVNGLQARSNTYHDIGMIWGARFISPRGIFRGANEAAPNGDAIARHIVFMTDGLLAPNIEIYGTYGVEWWSRRVTDDGSQGQAAARHAERFQAACRAAQRENIRVWVVAFGTELTENLERCASDGSAFVADDAEELEQRFEEIAQRIAALRLTE